MSEAELRVVLPNGHFSVNLTEKWLLHPGVVAQLPLPISAEYADSFLLHVPSGTYVHARCLNWPLAGAGLSLDDDSGFQATFDQYADSQWPGRRTAEYWRSGALRGATAIFEEAMQDALIREWLVTDGADLANFSTFATSDTWREILPDCEALVRSVRFEKSDI